MSGAAKSAVSLLVIDDNPGSLELLSNALAQPSPALRFSRLLIRRRDWIFFATGTHRSYSPT